MILTLTPNPSVDRTVEVDALVRGEVVRARVARVDPGGKGVNISRALAANGYPTRAVLPSGGAEGRQLAELLAPQGVEVLLVPVSGAVRANVTIVEPDGTITKINEPGPALDADEIEAMVRVALHSAADTDWVAASGSLPPGAPADFYARLVAVLRRAGIRVALDTSGPALSLALHAGPEVVKPNREELTEATGCVLDTLGDAVAAAAQLLRRGAGAVLASLGRDGALLVNRTGALHGEAPVDALRSAVGAGDATLAGFLAAGGRGPGALAEALAWGAAATSLPGSRMPGPDDLDRAGVRLHPAVDLVRRLEEASIGPPRGAVTGRSATGRSA